MPSNVERFENAHVKWSCDLCHSPLSPINSKWREVGNLNLPRSQIICAYFTIHPGSALGLGLSSLVWTVKLLKTLR